LDELKPVDENPNEEVDGQVFAQFQNFQNGDHTFWMHSISSATAAGRRVLVGFYFIFCFLFYFCWSICTWVVAFWLKSNIICF
jgi:hypothetical protein